MYPQLFSIKSFKFPPLLAGRHYLRKAEVQSREKYKTSSEFPRKILFETLDSYNELFNYCMSIKLQTVDLSEMCQTFWRSHVTKLSKFDHVMTQDHIMTYIDIDKRCVLVNLNI